MRTWLAMTSQRLGQTAEARNELGTARKLLTELLTQEPKNRKWLIQNARVVALMRPETSESRSSYLQRLRRTAQELLALDSGASAGAALSRLPDRAQLSLALASELQAQHQGDDALQELESMSATLRKAVEQRSDDLKLQTASAQVRLALADLRMRAGTTQAAHAQCTAVLGELDKVRSLLRVHFEITQAWVRAHACLGQPERAQGEQAWLARRTALQP